MTGTVGRLAIAWWDHGVLARQFARRDTVSITLCELRGYFEMMVPYQSATGVMLTLHHLEPVSYTHLTLPTNREV